MTSCSAWQRLRGASVAELHPRSCAPMLCCSSLRRIKQGGRASRVAGQMRHCQPALLAALATVLAASLLAGRASPSSSVSILCVHVVCVQCICCQLALPKTINFMLSSLVSARSSVCTVWLHQLACVCNACLCAMLINQHGASAQWRLKAHESPGLLVLSKQSIVSLLQRPAAGPVLPGWLCSLH